MSFSFSIEDAKIADLDAVQEIYSYYVENTIATLEEKKPSKQDIMDNYETVLSKSLPFIVAKHEGKVVGFSYALPFRKRSAYRYTLEESIYVHKDYLRKGIATALATDLIRKCSEVGYKQMIAVIVIDSDDYSVDFHKTVGFEEKGRLEKVGYKFNRWVDTVLMQKTLN
ncbi:MAG TPA: GNAT family N-acetyltransferase [Alphaproteobacteria bacterium]|nr:GNAT family N-acetyltransferase [Alphaproteobacteria bacterium]